MHTNVDVTTVDSVLRVCYSMDGDNRELNLTVDDTKFTETVEGRVRPTVEILDWASTTLLELMLGENMVKCSVNMSNVSIGDASSDVIGTCSSGI